MIVDVLGVKYRIVEASPDKDEYLKRCDGYCDNSVKRIVIKEEGKRGVDSIEDFGVYRRKIMRHEIIHAFLFESGLHENWKHDQWGHDESWIDWYAVQFPKLKKAFEQAGCVD